MPVTITPLMLRPIMYILTLITSSIYLQNLKFEKKIDFIFK